MSAAITARRLVGKQVNDETRDCDRAKAGIERRLERNARSRAVERAKHLSIRRDPFVDFDHAREQRWWPAQIAREDVRALLMPNHQSVAKRAVAPMLDGGASEDAEWDGGRMPRLSYLARFYIMGLLVTMLWLGLIVGTRSLLQ